MAVGKITKQLAGENDLLLGKGIEVQARQSGDQIITKLTLLAIADTVLELKALDITKFVRAVMLSDITLGDNKLVSLFHYDETSGITDNGKTVITPDSVSGVGRWLEVHQTSIELENLALGNPTIVGDYLSDWPSNYNVTEINNAVAIYASNSPSYKSGIAYGCYYDGTDWRATHATSYCAREEFNAGTGTTLTYIYQFATAAGDIVIVEDISSINNKGNAALGGTEHDINVDGVSIGVKSSVHTEGATDLAGSIEHRHSDIAAFGGHAMFARSRGTEDAEVIVQDGDVIARTMFTAFDGVTYQLGGEIRVEVDGVPGVDDMPMKIIFATTPNGSKAFIDRMFIDQAGNTGIGATPSAWGSDYVAIETDNIETTFREAATENAGVAHNCYNDGTNWLRTSAGGIACRLTYTVAGGQKFELYAAAGAADSVITWTTHQILGTDGTLEQTAGIYLGGAATANLLDDYEEGTSIVFLADVSGSDSEGQTYNSQTLYYTKIGDTVTYQFYMIMTSLGTLTPGDDALIYGLPFTALADANSYAAAHCGFAQGMNGVAGQNYDGYVQLSSTHIPVRKWDISAGQSNALISDFSPSTSIMFSGHYKTNL